MIKNMIYPFIALLTTAIASTSLASDIVTSTPVATAEHQVAEEKSLQPQKLIVKVSATGQVTEVCYMCEAPASIRDLLTQAVKRWRFAPELKDGKPVDWATQLIVTLAAVPVDGQFALKVKRVAISNISSIQPPRFSPEKIRTTQWAGVCVELTVGADGKPVDIRQVWVEERPATKSNRFAAAARHAAKDWTFEILEVDGVRYGVGGLPKWMLLILLPKKASAKCRYFHRIAQ